VVPVDPAEAAEWGVTVVRAVMAVPVGPAEMGARRV
jgi:hypothetical protein